MPNTGSPPGGASWRGEASRAIESPGRRGSLAGPRLRGREQLMLRAVQQIQVRRRRVERRLEARAAARLVLVRGAHRDAAFERHGALRAAGGLAADYADRQRLRDVL